MKVLITGATGFVGSGLVRMALQNGWDTNIFTRPSSNLWRITEVLAEVRNYSVALEDREQVRRLIKIIKPDIIYHMAVYGGFSSQKDQAAFWETNVQGTINLVQACSEVGFKIFVNTGSSSEYGLKHRPMREDDCIVPVGMYGVTKAAATLFCQSEAKEKQLPLITARIFSPYGPWDDPKRFIPYVIKSFIRNEKPFLSSPNSVRDYLFIDDVVKFYGDIIYKEIQSGEIYNVGSGTQVSLGEVVGQLTKIIGKSGEVEWGKVAAMRQEPEIWRADTSKVSGIGWRAEVSLEQGLEKTVEWMLKNLDKYL